MGSCRRDLLDQIIALNERHLHRLIREYVDYYHNDRIHDAGRAERSTDRAEAVSARDGDIHGTRRRPASPLLLARRGVADGRRLRDRSVLGLRPHRTLEANRQL